MTVFISSFLKSAVNTINVHEPNGQRFLEESGNSLLPRLCLLVNHLWRLVLYWHSSFTFRRHRCLPVKLHRSLARIKSLGC
jgi:hypothetical protein